MKHEMMTIMKKELSRFFKDKRMVVMTILMPGLMIYIMYSFMGSALHNSSAEAEGQTYKVSAIHMPDALSGAFRESSFDVVDTTAEGADEIKTKIENQETDLLIVFPEDFTDQAEVYDIKAADKSAPDVEIYFNSVSDTSNMAYQLTRDVLDGYEKSLSNKFDVNEAGGKNDLAKNEDVTGQMFSMLFPLLMMMFLFSGCMAVAPESIAGEKERGTIATLLVTPVKRSSLAMGKIIALSIISLLSGISSFTGVMLSLPKLMGGSMDTTVYDITDYLLILFVILTTVLVFVSLMSLISSFAKTVKEAGTAITPLMIVVMVLGISSMFGNAAPTELKWYLIPLYNSVLSMNGIFSFSYQMPAILLTGVINLIVTFIAVWLLNRIFASEKIMFGK